MNAHTDLIDRYFDAWNETDGARRRELIAATWSADADYRDPLLSGAGHEGIDAMIGAVHERFPHHTFRRTGQVDGYANRLRFSWELITPAGETIRTEIWRETDRRALFRCRVVERDVIVVTNGLAEIEP